MTVRVEFPDELLVATHEAPDAFQRQVVVLTLGHLYSQGRISSGLAAQILQCSRSDFYRLLSENGFNVIDYDPAELDEESETSHAVARRITP